MGEKGVILSTDNGGAQWKLFSIGVYPSLYSICFNDQSEGFVVGQDAILLYHPAEGQTWDPIELPIDAKGLSLFKIVIHGSLGIIVGDQGTVLRSINSGTTWSILETNLRPPLPWFVDVSILPSQKGIIIGGNGILKKMAIK